MTKICHFADSHFRGYGRHQEYKLIFEKFCAQMREQKPDAIVCAGDFYHNKCQNLTPEVIDLFVWCFESLVDVAPLHMILGNHDGLLNNDERQDVVSPIINAMGNKSIHLYKKSGVYPFGHGNFCVFSPFDKQNWHLVQPSLDDINIALFHGSVEGCILDNEMQMFSGEVPIAFFNNYDFALLGDIHRRQHLAYRMDADGNQQPYVSYPGSLIQQNFGEEESKGYLLWDIESKDKWRVSFVPIVNPTPFVTIPWKGSVQTTLDALDTSRPEVAGSRIRITCDKALIPIETKQLIQEIKEIRGASELKFKNEAKFRMDTFSTDSLQNIRKTSLRSDPDAIIGLYKEFIESQPTKYDLNDLQKDTAYEVIKECLEKLNKQEGEVVGTKDLFWRIKELEFDNLFRYNEGNKLNFDKLTGITGIFGKGRIGKSSILGAIMFGLFNTTDRGPAKGSQIVNHFKKSCNAKLLVNISGVDYLLDRTTTKVDQKRATDPEDKSTTNFNLYRVNSKDGNLIDLANQGSETRIDTDKILRKMIGSPQDFLLTAFANQFELNRFISEGATQRKLILNRFLDIDIFEKLFKFIHDDCDALNEKTARFSNVTWEVAILKAERRVKNKEDELREINQKIEEQRQQVDELTLWLKQYETNKQDLELISDLEMGLADLEFHIEEYTAEKETATSQLKEATNKLQEIEWQLAGSPTELLKERLVKLQEIKLNLQRAKGLVDKESSVLESQKKSQKKLETVPCGDTYPQCRFIKDSHEDKTRIDPQTKLVEELLSSYSVLEQEASSLFQENLETRIKENEALIDKKYRWSTQKILLQRKVEDLVTFLTDKENLKNQQNSSLNVLRSKVSNIGEWQAKQKEHATKKDKLASFEETRNNILVETGKEKATLEQLKQEKSECNLLLEKLRVYQSIESAFSKNGIPALVLKTQLPAINHEIAKIIGNIVDFQITLQTDVNANVMDVFLEDDGGKRAIEMACGTEKTIASIAIRAALINLSSLPKSDMFLLDEAFGSLDPEYLQKCLQLLSSLKCYFKNILIISHIPEIKEVADHIIEIKNVGSFSKVESL